MQNSGSFAIVRFCTNLIIHLNDVQKSFLTEHFWSIVTFGTECIVEQTLNGIDDVTLKTKCILPNKIYKRSICAETASFIS